MPLLRNADIYAPSPIGRADLLLAGGRIVRVEPGIRIPDVYGDVSDASGSLATPGFIDAMLPAP